MAAAGLHPHRCPQDGDDVPPDSDVAQPASAEDAGFPLPRQEADRPLPRLPGGPGRIRDGAGDGADAWDRILAELAAWAGTGLVSHEFFSMATAEQARAAVAALAPAEVHVVVTVRDYVRQFPAVWQEALKMNSD